MPRDPRAAYVHVPFCRHRCGYCNFTVLAGRDDLIERYLRALELELSRLEAPRPVQTLFIGGGTPTHLAPAQLRRLLELVRHWFVSEDDCEFSVEANPTDCTPERLELLSSAGVTRLSLGGQSFDAAKLQQLERDHTPAQVRGAIALAREHFKSVALDLIFATPGERIRGWEADLDAALELGCDHISTYGLTFERGTRFWSRLRKRELREADEALWQSMYATAIDRLTAAGFEHYEVSNFARPGHRCRHNQTYWAGNEYYAAGPGAARYVAGRREVNHRSATAWMERIERGESPVAESEQLESEDRARERLVLGLRQLEGIEPRQFCAETGFSVEQLGGSALARHLEMRTLEFGSGRLRLTRQGLFVSDAIWPDFLRV
jgi:oxygen-independent coproporphyrinogen-3 oxidase